MDFKFSTKVIHSSFHYDKDTGAVMPPIHLSTTFAQKSPGEPISQYEYSRAANPTRDILQNTLAHLENGRLGFCFSSGCAAMATLLQSFQPGDHVILSDDIYGGTSRLFAKVFQLWNIKYSQCDMTHPTEIEKYYQDKTRLIWIETPSNPLLKIIDIKKISQINQQQKHPAFIVVDNTFATPYLQNPLDLGADLVCHSTTKYLGGHSDILGGAIILNDPILGEKINFLQKAVGAVPSPFDCYLLLRSIKTLTVRMERHSQNAMKIAEYLSHHPKIEKVIYPGLPSHPQYELAKTQMRNFGGMISIVLKGTMDTSIQFLQRLKIFTLAESLGGVESLIEHPARMTHASIPSEHRKKIGIEDTLIRISVGIEDVNDLIADLEEALK